MGQVDKIFKVTRPTEHKFSIPQGKNPGAFEDYTVKKVVQSKEIQTGDHNSDGTRAEVVNVVYGTSETPPTATDTTIGTLYVQYTA